MYATICVENFWQVVEIYSGIFLVWPLIFMSKYPIYPILQYIHIFLSKNLFIHLSMFSIYMPFYLSIQLSIIHAFLSIYPSIYIHAFPSIYPSIYPFIYLHILTLKINKKQGYIDTFCYDVEVRIIKLYLESYFL